MIRTVIRPDKKYIKLDIPAAYVGKEIEITYLPLNEVNKESSKPKKTMKDFWGKLSDETAEKLHEHVAQSRDEWERNI